MKNLFSVLGMALMMMLAMTSCSDPDATTQLTDGIWKFNNMTTDSEDDDIILGVKALKLYHTEATIEFQSGGDFIKQYYLEQDPETGTWSLIGDDQLILTPDDGFPSTANINELTKDKLKYVETFVDLELNAYSLTTTWVRD